jgi:glycosyltransferase involved in cell wall biosynthesis
MKPLRLLVEDLEIIQGGVETVQLCLLPELAEQCECLVWVLPEHRREYFESLLGRNTRIIIESTQWPRHRWQRWLGALLRRMGRFGGHAANSWQEKLLAQRLDFLCRRYQCTHFFTTCIFHQPFPDIKVPVGGVIHDVNPNQPNSNCLQRNMVDWVQRADYVFCDSHFTATNVNALIPGFGHKLTTVPLAPPPMLTTALEPDLVQISNQFIYPASAIDNKDHLTLFQACLKLVRRGFSFQLVLTGPGTDAFWQTVPLPRPRAEEARLFLHRNASELRSCIQAKGYLSAVELNECYQQSSCIVLPSIYEGFGLPLAEAWQRGMPVICSDIPPFIEQIQLYDSKDWTEIFPAGNGELLAEKMEKTLSCSPATRRPLAVRQARLSRWTWQKVAAEYLRRMASCTFTPGNEGRIPSITTHE